MLGKKSQFFYTVIFMPPTSKKLRGAYWFGPVCPSLCLSSVTLAYGEEWFELESWNSVYSINMKNKWTCIFSFFHLGFLYRVIPLFRFRHLMTDDGYLVCATPYTVLYWPIWNFAGSFVMVCRYACDIGIVNNLIFVTFFFFYFWTSHFWGLNTIKVHYSGYLVCATPPTVLKLYRPFCHGL